MSRYCHICEHVLQTKDLDQLPAVLRFFVRRHLNRCSSCREFYESEVFMRRIFSTLPRLDLPARVREQIDRAVRSPAHGYPGILLSLYTRRQGISLSLAAAALALLMLVGPFGGDPALQDSRYTQEELEKARQQAEWSLAYAGRLVNKTGKNAVDDVFVEKIPGKFREVLENTFKNLQ